MHVLWLYYDGGGTGAHFTIVQRAWAFNLS